MKALHSTIDFALAYLAAFAAMGINPGMRMAQELGDLTRSSAECLEAVRRMTRARENMRVWDALDYLRELRSAERARA